MSRFERDHEFVKKVQKTMSEDTTTEAQKYFTRWMKLTAGEIANAFYVFFDPAGNGLLQTQRAVTYYLTKADFDSIMNQYKALTKPERANAKLRFYLGCDPKYISGVVQEDSPPFNPFAKLLTDAGLAPFANCKKMVWSSNSMRRLSDRLYPNPPNSDGMISGNNLYLNATSVSGQVNESVISPNTANLFIYEWCKTPDAQIPDLFSGEVIEEVARVKSYNFSAADLADVYEMWKSANNSGEDLLLALHLGVILPKLNTPFAFHMIMQILPIKSYGPPIIVDQDSTTGAVFEYAYPCPPYCQ